MGRLFFSELFDFLAAFDLVHENFGRFEAWDEMFINYKGRVAGYISRNFFLALFIDKASEPANVDVVSVRHGAFNNTEKCFD